MKPKLKAGDYVRYPESARCTIAKPFLEKYGLGPFVVHSFMDEYRCYLRTVDGRPLMYSPGHPDEPRNWYNHRVEELVPDVFLGAARRAIMEAAHETR